MDIQITVEKNEMLEAFQEKFPITREEIQDQVDNIYSGDANTEKFKKHTGISLDLPTSDEDSEIVISFLGTLKDAQDKADKYILSIMDEEISHDDPDTDGTFFEAIPRYLEYLRG